MIFFPAIDLLGGKCVRLSRGEREEKTDYSEDPVGIAKLFQEEGAQWIHVVDLDGAFDGVRKNSEAIRRIATGIKIPVQVGGGIRTPEDVRSILDLGVARVIMGTAAVHNPASVETSVRRFGAERVAVGIDARNGVVAVKGWVEETEIAAVDLGRRMKDAGVRLVVYTDINRDGMMGGPNYDETVKLAHETGLSVVISGGIMSIDDVAKAKKYEKDNIVGCISGKAIYEGRLSVREAVAVMEGSGEA